MVIFFYTISALLGLSVGSFLNAWVWRAQNGKSIALGRSECPRCGVKLQWHDNIPLLSFLLLRGRCRACRGAISWQYPLGEVGMMAVFMLFAWVHTENDVVDWVPLIRDWWIGACLMFIFIYDFLYREIHDVTTLIAGGILFVLSGFLGWQSWVSMGIGVVAAAGFFLFQYLVSRGRWIGGGDVRLGVLMGVVLGWPTVLVALFAAYVVGAFVSVVLLYLGKQTMQSETPFGTYLVAGTVFSMIWGQQVVDWYLHLLL